MIKGHEPTSSHGFGAGGLQIQGQDLGLEFRVGR